MKDTNTSVSYTHLDVYKRQLTTSAIVVFLGILGGYALAKLKFKGKSVITEVFFFVYMFSGILLIVPLYKLLSSIGLRNSHEAVIICMIIQTLPTAIYMTRSFFETIPDELEEAGRAVSYTHLPARDNPFHEITDGKVCALAPKSKSATFCNR